MTLSEEVGRVINTVDMLGVALATEMHIWTDEERSAYDYVSHNLPRRVQELEAERSDWRNIAEAALFQYDVLMKHAKELEVENEQLQKCHESELGVCQTECDVVAAHYAREVERLQRVIVATPRDDGLVCWWCDQQVWTHADDESEPTYHPELHKEDCEYRLAEAALGEEVGE
jgi:hypothetical protein